MKLKVDLLWEGGMIIDGFPGPQEPSYYHH
jgi:hypothetical protein